MKEVMKSIMAVIGIVLLSITLLLTLGLSFKGFRNKMRDIFDVVPEKQILSIQDENEDLNKIQANIQRTIDGLNKEKAELESTIEALENQADIDQSTIASYQTQLENLNNRIGELQNQMAGIQANVNGAIITCNGVYPRIRYWADDAMGGYEATLGGTERHPMPMPKSDVGMVMAGQEGIYDLFIINQQNNPLQAKLAFVELYDIVIEGTSTSLDITKEVLNIAENAEISRMYCLDGQEMDKESLLSNIGDGFCSYETIIHYTADGNIVNSIVYEVRITSIY